MTSAARVYRRSGSVKGRGNVHAACLEIPLLVFHSIVDGGEPAPAVDNCNDEDALPVYAVNHAVTVDEALTNVVIIEFWHDAPGQRKVLEVACVLDDFSDDALGIKGAVTGDVAGDVVDVGERLGRPAYCVVHLARRASASSKL